MCLNYILVCCCWKLKTGNWSEIDKEKLQGGLKDKENTKRKKESNGGRKAKGPTYYKVSLDQKNV